MGGMKISKNLDNFDKTILEYIKLNTMLKVNDVRRFFQNAVIYPRLAKLKRYGYVKIEHVKHLRGNVVKLTHQGIELIKPKLA